MTQFQQPDSRGPEGAPRQRNSKSMRRATGCWLGLVGAAVLLLCGCTTSRPSAAPLARPFDFQTDTFTFANELVWNYAYDPQGHWTTHRREPKPSYYQHCFVVARTAKQFFLNARFDPSATRAD